MSEINDIIETFNDTGSIKGTAKQNHCSWHRVAKILSSNGIVINDTHAMILFLHDRGLSVDQIAKQTRYSPKTIRAYLPGIRPTYKVDLSINAQRIKKCRERRVK